MALGQRQYQIQDDWVILKIAPNGQVIRDTILYRSLGNEYPADVLVDVQGNYVLYGWTSNGTVPPGGFPDLVLAKFRRWTQTLGTNEEGVATAEELTLYPNPTHETVHLHGPTPLRGALTLSDALGRVVRTYRLAASAADAALSLAGLPAGLYLLSFSDAATAPATRTWHVVKEYTRDGDRARLVGNILIIRVNTC